MTHPLLSAVLVNLGIPTVYLVVDYVCFDHGLDPRAIIAKSGPDLSLIGLGALGAIFTDDKVSGAMQIPVAIVIACVVAVILILRGICYRVEARSFDPSRVPGSWLRAFASFACGVGCIGTVSGVLMYGYLN